MVPAPTPVSSNPARLESKRSDDEEVRPYVVVSEIGKGSFATVYRGYHEETRAAVAIKTVSRSILTTKLLENLESEITILKQLKHKHITELIEIVKTERNIYLIMEFCSGGDLSVYIKRRGKVDGLQYVPAPGEPPIYYPHSRTGGLDEVVVRSFLKQLARALKFLRDRNLIHRDIKPQNLLLSPASESDYNSGHPLGVPVLKVADFGFARSLPNATMAETLCGSPLYMAPEILRYEKYDAKVDLWSVGAVLYEMSVGKPPFRAQNHIELLKRIEQAKSTVRFPDEEDINVNPVPADIKKLIRALLKRHSVERASFDDFFAAKALKSRTPPPSEATSISNTFVPPEIPDSHKIIPPEVLDPKALIPPSQFHFRRPRPPKEQSLSSSPATPSSLRSSPLQNEGKRGVMLPPIPKDGPSPSGSRPPSHYGNGVERNLSSSPASSPPYPPKPLPVEGADDDRQDYVLVGDTRVVEFNRAVDEIDRVRERVASRADSPIDHNRFPPPPRRQSADTIGDIADPPGMPMPPTRTASSALSKALTMASKKLFGTPSSPPTAPRKVTPRRHHLPVPPEDVHPTEDKMLAELENVAQKAHVLLRWADETFEHVQAIPKKPIPDPSKFEPKEGERARSAAKRRHADVEAQESAVTCVALYMLVMSFAQKGLEALRAYVDFLDTQDEGLTPGAGYDDALEWFKATFQRCSERAHLVKTWLPEGSENKPSAYIDQLVYDKALSLSRAAARKEILDQDVWECEAMYEDALWILYSLSDDIMQVGNPFMEEDRTTIEIWITRTKLRLVRCRNRASMDHRARIQDARADQNLDDVNRSPAPWEIKPPTS